LKDAKELYTLKKRKSKVPPFHSLNRSSIVHDVLTSSRNSSKDGFENNPTLSIGDERELRLAADSKQHPHMKANVKKYFSKRKIEEERER
jgi:hypothetical protein